MTYFDRSDPRKITAFKQIGTFNLCVNIPFVLFFSCLARWCVLTFLQLIALSCLEMTGTLTAALIGWLALQREWSNLFIFPYLICFVFQRTSLYFLNFMKIMNKVQRDILSDPLVGPSMKVYCMRHYECLYNAMQNNTITMSTMTYDNSWLCL